MKIHLNVASTHLIHCYTEILYKPKHQTDNIQNLPKTHQDLGAPALG